MKDKQPIHKGKCSTGSYILLKASGNRQWLFKTPRGMFKVTVKLKNPVWYKPDWAYLEEGLAIPSRYSPQRYQEGVLGDFALAFGKGYLIHGTLYKRMLGLPVTHGCVRLDDDDMYQVFHKLTHGSKIFIY
jgi:L,D-transpeptidase YbiS